MVHHMKRTGWLLTVVTIWNNIICITITYFPYSIPATLWKDITLKLNPFDHIQDVLVQALPRVLYRNKAWLRYIMHEARPGALLALRQR